MSESRKIFGRNVKLARTMLNLSQQELATILILSKATINNIEAGRESVANDILLIICKFLGFTKVALENEGFIIEDGYRERLAKKHGKRYNILHEQPELKFAIRHYLLKSDVLNQPVERIVILNFFKSKGWNYHGGSLSNALIEMSDVIKSEFLTNKGNTRVYSKK